MILFWKLHKLDSNSMNFFHGCYSTDSIGSLSTRSLVTGDLDIPVFKSTSNRYNCKTL